jgi:hypothetical protein
MAWEKDIRRIEEREALLDREIAERQKLKEAYRLVREDLALGTGNGAISEDEETIAMLFPGPERETLAGKAYGTNTKMVKWAISKMTDDYTIRDLHNYLRTHGHECGINPIATVLNRLKKNGEIKERVPGRGRRATLFKR